MVFLAMKRLIEWKMTVPNALSLVRLVLVPVFVWAYLSGWLAAALIVLVLSGLTDAMDGWIARRFNQISDLGKLLDPLADKLTQLAVVVCLAIRHPQVIPLVVVCAVKEGCQIAGGLLMMRRGIKVKGAKWYGKVSTVLFYGVMAFIVLWPTMPSWLMTALVAVVGVWMLFTFYQYGRVFAASRREADEPCETTNPEER